MTYYHTEDIDATKEFNANDLDEKMMLCLNRITSSFNKLENTHSISFRSLMEELFKSFISTHKSIRLLLKECYKDFDEAATYAPDAKSLVREQIEKVFLITLILNDPEKWMWLYFQDDWKRFYKFEILVEIEERKNLPRFTEADDEYKERIENLRKYSNVSEAQKELIEHKFSNPNVSKPAHLAGVEIPQFPLPSDIIRNHITDPTSEILLKRWHKEYEFICGFSHIGADKLTASIIQNKSKFSTQDIKRYIEYEIILPTLILSYLAVASACSICWKVLIENDPDLSKSGEFLSAVLDFWEDLRKLSLKGKVFWDIHAKQVFPHIIGQ